MTLVCPWADLRFRPKGSAGGQKGLADIIRRVGSDQFARLRLGIDAPPPQWDPADYVLGRFDAEERAVMDEAVQRAARGVDDWVRHGTEYCMNAIQRDVNAPRARVGSGRLTDGR